MTYDYGDMARESNRRRYEESILRQYGKEGDPPEFAVELAEGRRAIETLYEARLAWARLRSSLGGYQ